MIAKSEDLPWVKLLSHESLAENMQIRLEQVFLACAFLRRLFHFLLFRREYGSVSVQALYSPIDPRKGSFPMKKNVKRILAAALFVLLIAALAFVYVTFGEKAVSGSKAVTLEVISSAAEKTVYSLRTDAEYLSEAMEEAEGLTFVAEEGPYGLAVSSVNGETADFNVNGAYWGFFVNGEYCNYGISQQPVHDGDVFTIAYTK